MLRNTKNPAMAITATVVSKALPQFRKVEMESRQQLYRQLADRVWDPQQLALEAQGAP